MPACAGLINGLHRDCTAPALRLHDTTRSALLMHRDCIRAAWPMSRNAGGITGMESTSPEKQKHPGLPIVTDMINHRGQVRPKFGKELGDLVKPELQGIKPGPRGTTVRYGLPACLLRAALEHPVKAFRLPPESHGQGLERAAVTAALHGMPLDLPNDGQRHMRTLRKLPLTPAKLADTVADSPSDRSPVPRIAFRHAILRAPLPAPRLADPYAIPQQTGTNRNQAKAFRNNYGAEIGVFPMISALREELTRGLFDHKPPITKGPKATEGSDAV